MRTTRTCLSSRASRLWSHVAGRGLLVLAGLALLTGVTAACGGGTSPSSTSPPVATSPPAQSSPGQAAGARITATLTDFHIALSQQHLTPGTYTFVAVNSGHTTHALAIDGPGVAEQQTQDLQPGQSATMTVTLQPGSYDVDCPVDGHKQLGMDTTVTVAGAGGPGQSVAPSPTGGSGY